MIRMQSEKLLCYSRYLIYNINKEGAFGLRNVLKFTWMLPVFTLIKSITQKTPLRIFKTTFKGERIDFFPFRAGGSKWKSNGGPGAKKCYIGKRINKTRQS